MMSGTHPGCVEARSVTKFHQLARQGVCEFDGRLSLAYSEDQATFFLYARANLAPLGGGRAVQVSTSTDMRSWTPFEPVVLAGHTSGTSSDGDTYFFLVQPNPVHRGSLIAIFPLVQHARGCIGLALSIDGKEWSQVTPLMRCAVHGERAENQPVGGLILLPPNATAEQQQQPTQQGGGGQAQQQQQPQQLQRRRRGGRGAHSAGSEVASEAAATEGRVAIFMHMRVPDIAFDELAPHRLFKTHQAIAMRKGGSHIVRHTMPCGTLALWTAEMLTELAASGRPDGQRPAAKRMVDEPERFKCPPRSRRMCPSAAQNELQRQLNARKRKVEMEQKFKGFSAS